MPGRRPVKKGSFSGHFDELVKHFVPAAPARLGAAGTPRKPKPEAKRAASLNQKLFDRAHH